MGAHGGYMSRSLSRFATLVGSAALVGLVAGCGSSGPGAAVLGVPHNAPSVAPRPSGDILAGLQQAISNELAAVNATQSDNEAPQVLIELQALNSISSLARAENVASLMAVGANETAKRERVVNALITEVRGNSFLDGVNVGGASLAQALIAKLEAVNNQLGALASSIAAASLTDELRSDIISINASTRIYGLVEPVLHLALAGGDELSAVNKLTGTATQLAVQVAAGAGTDANYAQEQSWLHDMTSKLASARQTANAAVSAVLSLTASGFPGNKGTITSARAQLTQLRGPAGFLGLAQADLARINNLLSLRS
jgi:hypothetical protein